MKADNSIISLIKEIIKRPPLYQVNKVEDIGLIILGYSIAQESEGNSMKFSDDFRLFVNTDFETTDKNYPWEKLIRFHSGNDSHSLKLFNQLFEDYLDKHGAKLS